MGLCSKVEGDTDVPDEQNSHSCLPRWAVAKEEMNPRLHQALDTKIRHKRAPGINWIKVPTTEKRYETKF